MNSRASISVCIPVYNGAAHLRECLVSVAAQEGVGLEVVVRDDGSKDGSLELVESLAREFPEVEWNIARNAANLGMVGNWNACLMAAKGEFVKMMGQETGGGASGKSHGEPVCLGYESLLGAQHPSFSQAAPLERGVALWK